MIFAEKLFDWRGFYEKSSHKNNGAAGSFSGCDKSGILLPETQFSLPLPAGNPKKN